MLREYRERGYTVARGLFTRDEIAAIAAAVDRVRDEANAHGQTFRHGNLFYRLVGGEVRMAQWFSYAHPEFDALRRDRRWLGLLEPLIGPDIKQIINQLHWKPPGTFGDFAWHQDSRSRRPAEAYRNLGTSYVQTGLAIDPHNPESGGLRFVPGSHLRGDLEMPVEGRDVMSTALADSALTAAGFDPANAVDLDLAPGDVALWSPFLIHGSAANRSTHPRRFHINGYVRAGDCDRGEWAFRDGVPVPLGPDQALVHYEALRERPEPHYPDAADGGRP
jgi:ectoine hydroxylase-related dioxygenase (phytanoyl-CoA dioxygenase family)